MSSAELLFHQYLHVLVGWLTEPRGRAGQRAIGSPPDPEALAARVNKARPLTRTNATPKDRQPPQGPPNQTLLLLRCARCAALSTAAQA